MPSTGTPDTLLRLRDTPDTYAGQTGKSLRVKTTEDGVEYFTPSTGSGTVTSITATDPVVITPDPTTTTGDISLSGTKAQFDTSCSDGNFLYVGDVTQYTDELAQDAVGGMVDTTLNYVDATPLLQRAALTGAVTAALGSNTTALGSFDTSQLNTALSDNDVATGGGTCSGACSGTNTGDQSLAGLVPTSRTLTINGDAQDLSSDRTWTVTASNDLYPNLQVLTADYTMPANTSLVFVQSLTLSNNVDLIIPDTSAILIEASTPGGDVVPTSKVVTEFSTTASLLTNIPGLTFAASANTKYEVDSLLIVQATGTSGVSPAIQFSAVGATGSYVSFGNLGTSNSGNDGQALGANATNVNFVTVASTTRIVWLKAVVEVGVNAGNITTQILKAGGGSLIVYPGSRQTVTKLWPLT